VPDSQAPAAPHRTLWRFLLVGCANAAIDTGVYLLLSGLGLDLYLANLVSTSCGLLFSFFANRSFTFRAVGTGRRRAALQFALFVLVVGFGLWVIQPLVIVAATPVGDALGWLPAWLRPALPKLLAIGVALVWNYAMFRLVVFRRPRAAIRAASRSE